MITPGIARPLCLVLASIIAMPAGFGQSPPGPQASQTPAQPPQAPPPPVQPPAPRALVPGLTLSVIEGANAVNSISLLRSVAPVVEVQDANSFPVEGAVVSFTLPGQGPGGTFLNGRNTFTTRSDAHGQAAAPFTMNSTPGKFQIVVTATLGDRKGETTVTQTNTAGVYVGPALPKRSWYKKWPAWAIAGGVVAGAIVWAVTRNSGSSATPVTITPGAPVFQ